MYGFSFDKEARVFLSSYLSIPNETFNTLLTNSLRMFKSGKISAVFSELLFSIPRLNPKSMSKPNLFAWKFGVISIILTSNFSLSRTSSGLL